MFLHISWSFNNYTDSSFYSRSNANQSKSIHSSSPSLRSFRWENIPVFHHIRDSLISRICHLFDHFHWDFYTGYRCTVNEFYDRVLNGLYRSGFLSSIFIGEFSREKRFSSGYCKRFSKGNCLENFLFSFD